MKKANLILCMAVAVLMFTGCNGVIPTPGEVFAKLPSKSDYLEFVQPELRKTQDFHYAGDPLFVIDTVEQKEAEGIYRNLLAGLFEKQRNTTACIPMPIGANDCLSRLNKKGFLTREASWGEVRYAGKGQFEFWNWTGRNGKGVAVAIDTYGRRPNLFLGRATLGLGKMTDGKFLVYVAESPNWIEKTGIFNPMGWGQGRTHASKAVSYELQSYILNTYCKDKADSCKVIDVHLDNNTETPNPRAREFDNTIKESLKPGTEIYKNAIKEYLETKIWLSK